MLTWLKNLFTSLDRQTAAAERAAVAMEDIATDLEGMRDQFRARLGIEAPKPLAVVAAKNPDDEEPTAGRKAKK